MRRLALLLVAAAAVGACTASERPPPPGAAGSPLACPGADGATGAQFVDSLGVATHLSYRDTPYADADLVRDRLRELGVRHVRDGWPAGDRGLAERARALAADGVRLTFVHDPREGGTPADQHRLVRENLLGVVEAAESLNEPDTRGEDWQAGALDWTRRLAAAYASDPATAALPVLAPSVSQALDEQGHRGLSPLTGVVDAGNTHDYPGKSLFLDDETLDRILRNQRAVVGGAPVQATETGYSDGRLDAPYEVMSQEAVAVLLPRLFLEHFRRGIARTFAYELLDEGPGGAFEDGFGLVEQDGTPKPSFRSTAALVRALDGPVRCDQPPLRWSLRGADDTVRTVLLRGGEDQWFLAVWRQVHVWGDGRLLADAPLPVRLVLGNETGSVRQLRPAGGDEPAREGGREIEVDVSGRVTLVQLDGVRPAPAAGSPSTGPGR